MTACEGDGGAFQTDPITAGAGAELVLVEAQASVQPKHETADV